MTTHSHATDVQQAETEALVLRRGEGAWFQIGQLRLTVKEAGRRSAGQVVITEMLVPVGAASPPAHIHHQGGESWYVLEGELDVLVGAEQGRYGPGSFVMIPAGTPHRFANASAEPVRGRGEREARGGGPPVCAARKPQPTYSAGVEGMGMGGASSSSACIPLYNIPG